MTIQINGKPILDVTITEDRIGAWTASVEADSEEPITGAVTLDIEGEIFVGTVWQGDVDSSRWKGVVVGGGGGTQKLLEGVHYERPTATTVLTDLARDAGEVLSPDILPSLLTKQLEFWSRVQGFAHTAFLQLADELGVGWRITRTGQLWFGEETWAPITINSIEGDYSPEHRMLEVAYVDNENDRPVLRPGVTYEGEKIQRVVTKASHEGLRQFVFFDDERGQSGILNTIRRVIREVVWPKLQLARVHAARVCEQDSVGDVTLAVEDDAIGGRSRGVSRVPLVLGLPGTRIRTNTQTRVRLMWDGGNPTKPRAAHFDQGTPVDELAFKTAVKHAVETALAEIKAADRFNVETARANFVAQLFTTNGETRLGSEDAVNFVALANLVLTELNDIRTKFDAHTHAVETTGSASAQAGSAAPPLPPMGPASSVAATQTKAS